MHRRRLGFRLDHIATLRQAGYTAFLVGEHIMKSGDPSYALKELVAA